MLYDELLKYAQSDVYPMHMPGHKRNKEFLPKANSFELDITEIHGFDDLRNPQGFLKETEALAVYLYGSLRAFLLVNGSTSGILAAIGAHTKRGDKILFAPSSHRSVSNAVRLFGLRTVNLDVDTDESSGVQCSVSPTMVESALNREPDIKLVVITSPSYEGVVSDIKAIADIVHSRDIILLVDSAHGAHLGFSDGFPSSATKCGADIVVMSLHKTLPALTQCSLLHVCSERADIAEIYRFLFTLQTSSPSYLFMSSIDYCLRLLDTYSIKLFNAYEHKLTRFYKDVKVFRNLRVIGTALCPSFFAFDPGKIVISTKNTGLSGFVLADILRDEYKIELELAHNNYAIAMTSICDTWEGFSRLASALSAIDDSMD